MGRVFAAAGAAFALYLGIMLWSLPIVRAEAAGLDPFDLRPFGYGVEEARAFLTALSVEGAAFYRGTHMTLDTAYAALLALALALGLAEMRPPALRGLTLLAAPVLITGWMENAHVRGLIDAGAEVSAAEVVAASRWTVAASSSVALACLVLLGLLMLKFVAALRE